MVYEDSYFGIKEISSPPRLPLGGNIDLTYRCNNNCRHCWLRIPPNAEQKIEELSFKEIKQIIKEAKLMGCRSWAISGGEPMLRDDFLEIFDYIAGNCAYYSINTSGTLITPRIAKLMNRKGFKIVALYGATADVHDRITRNPGSFEAAMRGCAYLKEAKTAFTVQLIPMRDNYHQFKEMVKLAESLSRDYKLGSPCLFLSASGDKKKNNEIKRQRLRPKDVVGLHAQDYAEDDRENKGVTGICQNSDGKPHLFSSCINSGREFYIDPYGKMTFCSWIKDPKLRYDLKKGSFRQYWEGFIPSIAAKIKASAEYKKGCGSCKLRNDCFWCPVYAYLEHRSFNSKVDYFCAIAKENSKYKDSWRKNHRRYFKVADITIQLESDQAIRENTFSHALRHFEVSAPGKDTVFIRHHFFIPGLKEKDLGKELYRNPPWAIYKKGDSWVYAGISPDRRDKSIHKLAIFNSTHDRARVYNSDEKYFISGDLNSLTFFPTDQIILAKLLADRKGCYLHSSGVDLAGKGMLFAGHSGAGKSTVAKILKDKAKILCDDRIIVRRKKNGFNMYGTWSHGELPDVSADPVPLKAIFFLEKSRNNLLIPLSEKREKTIRLIDCVVKPLVTADWWKNTLSLLEDIADNVPCYILKFDKSQAIVKILCNL